MKRLTLSQNLETIPDGAFYGCNRLAALNVPASVKSIGHSAFYGCNALTTLSLPDGITEIKEHTFENCSSLTKLSLPHTVSSIGSYAFANCTKMGEINLHEGITQLGWEAFSYSKALYSVTLPASLRKMRIESLWEMNRLKSIYVKWSDRHFIDSIRTNVLNTALSEEWKGKVYVPRGMKQIYESVVAASDVFDNATEVIETDYDIYGITIDAKNGWTSHFSQTAYVMPEGLTGYIVTDATEEKLTMEARYSGGETVADSTALLIKGTPKDEPYYYTLSPESTVVRPENNLLYGTLLNENTSSAEQSLYYEFTESDEQGNPRFDWAEENGGSFINKAHVAYLAIPCKTGVTRSFFVFDSSEGTFTDITNIRAKDQLTNDTIYNLQGQKMTNIPAKGIYIIGRKKVLR